MPTLAQLIQSKTARLEKIPDNLFGVVEASQRQIFDELIILVESLDTKGGIILLSDANLARVEQIANQLSQAVFNTEYLEAITNFAGEFNTQAELNDDIFRSMFSKFETKDLYRSITTASQKTAIDLLSEAGINQNFITPLKTNLTNSITTGQSFAQMVTGLRDFVEGSSEAEGSLLRYVKQVARDSYSIADRTYTTTVSQDIGIDWFKYSGSTVTDTRDFCLARFGKFFHRKEVEGWGNIKKWDGRINGTNSKNIFNFAGGWNCLHSIQPVSIEAVPKSVIDRNVANGNIKRSDANKSPL